MTEAAEQIQTQEASETEVVQDNAVKVEEKGQKEWVDPEKDLLEDPAKVKARIDYLYKKTKKQDRELQDWRKIDAERQRAILELTNASHVIVDHLATKSLADSEAQLNKQMLAAFEAGDNKTYIDAQDKLIEIKAQKIAQQTAKKNQPAQQQVQQQERLPSMREAAEEGFNDGDISYEEKQYAQAWIDETTETGEPLRPWAITPDPNDPDPDHVKAWVITQKVFSNPQYAKWSVQQKLAEIDKKMGVTKTAPRQSVMGGGLTGKTKTANVELTPKQREIALATKFGGPKAKSDADHIEAYRRAVLKTKGVK